MKVKHSHVIFDSTDIEQELIFPMAYKCFSVTNLGDNDIYASLRSSIAERLTSASGLYNDIVIVPSGSTAIISAGQPNIYIYKAGRLQIVGVNDTRPVIIAAIGGASSSPDVPQTDLGIGMLYDIVYISYETKVGDTLYEEVS